MTQLPDINDCALPIRQQHKVRSGGFMAALGLFDLLQLGGLYTLGMDQIPPQLKIHPEFRGHPEESSQTKCRTRRDSPPTVHKFVDPLEWDANPIGPTLDAPADPQKGRPALAGLWLQITRPCRDREDLIEFPNALAMINAVGDLAQGRCRMPISVKIPCVHSTQGSRPQPCYT